MQNRIKPLYYRRLLRSMLVLFLLPALSTVVVVSILQVTTARKQATDLQMELVEKLSAVVDQQLNTGIQMAFHCASDSFFLDMSRQAYDLLTFKEISHKLVAFCATNAYVDDIVILLKDKPMNYAAKGIYPNYDSLTALYIDGALPEAYCSDDKNQYIYRRAMISRSGNIEDALLYVFPSHMRSDLAVTILMKSHLLLDVLKSGDQAQGSLDILFNHEGECLLSSRKLEEQMLTAIWGWTDAEGNGNSMAIDGVKYLAFRKLSSSSGITYVHCEPESNILSSQLSVVLFVFLSLTTCGTAYVVIRQIAKRNYQPVKALCTNIGNTGSIPAGIDEFSAITVAFHNLKALIGTYDETLQNQIPANRMRLMSNLFGGYYDSLGDFNFAAAFAGVKFTMPHYWVALASGGAERFEENIVTHVEAMLLPTLEALGARTHNPHECVFVFAGIEAMPIQSLLEDVLRRCADSMRTPITVTLSECRKEFSSIGQAYIECRSLHSRVNGNGKLNLFVSDPKDTVSLLRISGELQELFSALREAILDGRVDDVMLKLEYFSKSLKSKRLSYFEEQCVCYDLANCVIHALSDLLCVREFAQLKLPELTELISFKNESDLVLAIGELSRLVSEELRGSSFDKKQNKPAIDDVIGYIHAHCADYDFSVKQLADRYGMSLSVFSQYFKAQYKMSAIVYILQCRIDRAKYLLENTDMTIADIVLSIGYISIPTFTSKFKQACGLTPGEYRETRRKPEGVPKRA